MPDTTTARHYVRVPLEVAAVQWTGSNPDELAALLGAHFAEFKTGPAVLTRFGWTPLHVSNVAVLGPGGAVSLMSAEDFLAEYEEVAHA